jgi:hypothetical protein
MEVCQVSGIAPPVLNLDTVWRCAVIFMLRPHCTPLLLWHPLNRWVVGPQSRCSRFEDEDSIVPLPGTETWIDQAVAQSLH